MIYDDDYEDDDDDDYDLDDWWYDYYENHGTPIIPIAKGKYYGRKQNINCVRYNVYSRRSRYLWDINALWSARSW